MNICFMLYFTLIMYSIFSNIVNIYLVQQIKNSFIKNSIFLQIKFNVFEDLETSRVFLKEYIEQFYYQT